jgi:hypothetical protein
VLREEKFREISRPALKEFKNGETLVDKIQPLFDYLSLSVVLK